MKKATHIILIGLLAGFISQGLLGILFVNSLSQSILYNPEIQSRLFIDITPTRNIPLSVGGLVVLSIIHAWLFVVFAKSIPGTTWIQKGLFLGSDAVVGVLGCSRMVYLSHIASRTVYPECSRARSFTCRFICGGTDYCICFPERICHPHSDSMMKTRRTLRHSRSTLVHAFWERFIQE